MRLLFDHCRRTTRLLGLAAALLVASTPALAHVRITETDFTAADCVSASVPPPITTPEATSDKPVIVSNLRLPGKYFDEETGLHYKRHRYYAPGGGDHEGILFTYPNLPNTRTTARGDCTAT